MPDRSDTRSGGREPTALATRPPDGARLAVRNGMSIVSGGLAIAAVASGHLLLLIPAGVFAFVAGAVALLPLAAAQGLVPTRDPSRGSIGMGATVEAGAVVEPGARVDMGATVRSGAVIRRGAVVGMGATVEKDAVIEEDASIGWGVTVREGAVVRRGASVGAGCTVESGAVVQEGARIGAGGTVAGVIRGASLPKTEAALQAGKQVSTAPVDPRDVRIDEICDRFEAELDRASAAVNEFIRDPKETVAAARRTCHDLLRRERELRQLANPEDQERLNREAAALESRIAAEPDEVTKRQLQGAVKAIEEQRQQRALVLRDANRLEAEQTRLAWTMEGLVAHIVRLRTTEAGGASADLERGLSQLRDEMSSVTTAIEHVQTLDLSMAPFEPSEGAPAGSRQKETAGRS
jgi:carbonic anhydrase/acetyltransferase-like protein (isoleucine patch superfamily)